MNLRIVFAAVTALSLAACASQPAATTAAVPAAATEPSNPLVALQTFTLADIQAASADAHAQPAQPGCSSGDCTAYQCYDWLSANLPSAPSFTAGSTVGAVLLFQKGRDALNGVSGSNGFLASFNRACAPLATDVKVTLAKFGLIAAGTAATGGALAPAAAGLPALGAALPIPLP